jgi:chromosomal replication initiator protein
VNVSLPQIGVALGGRDHTTVMYAIDQIANKIETDSGLRRDVIDIKQQMYGQAVV